MTKSNICSSLQRQEARKQGSKEARELAEVSKGNNRPPTPDNKNHRFAKDGFTYRTAYFEDYNGEYYRITISIGNNGDVATVYNVGKIKKRLAAEW